MFDIGFSELLIVAVVALIVLGPEKLPSAIRTAGLWIGRFRRSVSAIQAEISEELRLDEIRRTTAIEKEELEKELNEMRQPFTSPLDQVNGMSSAKVPDDNAKQPEPEKPASAENPSDRSSS